MRLCGELVLIIDEGIRGIEACFHALKKHFGNLLLSIGSRLCVDQPNVYLAFIEQRPDAVLLRERAVWQCDLAIARPWRSVPVHSIKLQ